MNQLLAQRAGPLFGVVLVVAGILAALTPGVPAVRALDPTPEPSPSLDPGPGVTPDPSPSAVPSAVPGPSDGASPDPGASPSATAAPSPTVDPSPPPGDQPSPTVQPSNSAPVESVGLRVDHVWIDTMDARMQVASRGPRDAALSGAQRFTVYRVRFRVVNDGDTALTLRPALQAAGAGGWSVVPAVDPAPRQPFYVASDDDRTFKVREAVISARDLREPDDSDSRGVPVDGVSSAGRNPATPIRLPGHGFTEIEFAVRATMFATWSTSYQLRLADGTTPVSGTMAVITLGAAPPVHLSPGQRSGAKVAEPVPLYPLDLSGVDTASDRYAVRATTAGLRLPFAAPQSFVSPHTNYTLTTDACASCHAAHSAQGSTLYTVAAPRSNLCFQCHDGSGAVSNVLAEWKNPALPSNDPATSSWYSHPALQPSSHTSDRQVEFAGVLNRHSECVDCHQPHNADATRPVGTTSGWTAAGAIKGAAGVTVTNGAAGAAPSYALGPTSTLEYELCFKCHSGYTQLPAQDPLHPSRWSLDKGVELNPANVSYHPVEAPGRNQSSAMALSLSGTSPSKLWSFDTTSTIRCENCHGNPALANPLAPPPADAQLDNHASTNRGILIAPYRDRDLKAATELYAAADFSLCYACHAEAPMVDDSGNVRYDTNFNWHGFHLNDIWYKGTGGRDIDVAGAGQGNATCAECHFRIHGTALAVSGQAPATGLVNFAPDVQPYNGALAFVPATSTTLGSCTLTCHGKAHNAYVYAAAP